MNSKYNFILFPSYDLFNFYGFLRINSVISLSFRMAPVLKLLVGKPTTSPPVRSQPLPVVSATSADARTEPIYNLPHVPDSIIPNVGRVYTSEMGAASMTTRSAERVCQVAS